MTEIEIVQAVTDNRAAFSSLSIGYGMLSLNLILAAYLFRNFTNQFQNSSYDHFPMVPSK
ncbi:MAG: hypothetical protein P8J18_03795 [Halieaceae bacterium]|nr:hypothetical protein [Halieaceae bacterium]